jgi:hypothetical protein
MRVVLVRLTGTRDAVSDPMLSALIDDASHYVRLERATTGGATQVIFDAAQERGLPLLVSSEPAALDSTALLAAARRAGASAALRAQSAPDNPGEWQWTLIAPVADGQWVGNAAAGIDGATDALVHTAQTLAAAPVVTFDCRVTGVTDLSGFSAVLDAVRQTPGVTAVHVRDIDGDVLALQLAAHGNQAVLAHALAGERLVPLDPGQEGALAYRYQAGP